MAFGHDAFSAMMRDANWTKNIMGTVIDEAHCVLDWKDKFRTAFGDFRKARAYLPGKPIFATSATLTPMMINSLSEILCFNRSNSFVLNIGNDRPNITSVVCKMAGGESDFQALDFLLDEVNEGKDLICTIVFFNTREITRRAGEYIRSKLPPESSYQGQIFSIWATKSSDAKRRIMNRFRSGKIKILFATEVAGMVCTIYSYIYAYSCPCLYARVWT
jgi:superfamily II DNA helicase RecQ